MQNIVVDSEFKSLIPKISDGEYRLLEESILAEGCRDALIVWLYDARLLIIDGHNRYEICTKHNLPYDVKTMFFDSRDDAKIWIIKNQFGRRNLSLFQRSELALELKPLLSAMAKENQIRKPISVGKNSCQQNYEDEIKKTWADKTLSSDVKANLVFDIRQRMGREIRRITNTAESLAYIAITAQKIKIGVSTAIEDRIKTLTTSDPDITLVDVFSNGRELEKLIVKKFDHLSLGGEWFVFSEENLKQILSYARQEDDRLNRVDVKLANIAGVSHDTIVKVEKIAEESPPEIIQSIRDGDLTINKAYTQIVDKERNEKERQLKESLDLVPLPNNVYDVVVIDPPWDMQKILREIAPNQKEFDYPTMTINEIKTFPIKDLMSDNCHIFLWTTQKYLPFAFDIIKEWGLTYVLTMVWHKNGGFQPFGLPQYNCEFILYAHKGNPKFIDTKTFNCCFNGERGKHSEKPNEFYELLDRVCDGNKIDIFARKERKGWSVYGNEVI